MQILEFYHKDQKSPESIQRFEINTCLLRLCIRAGLLERQRQAERLERER